jgi:hypothetical protein
VPGTCARASKCDDDDDFECHNEDGGRRVSTGSSDDVVVVLAVALAKTLKSRRKSVYKASIFKITILYSQLWKVNRGSIY